MNKIISQTIQKPPIILSDKTDDKKCFNCLYCRCNYYYDERSTTNTCIFYKTQPEVIDDNVCSMHKPIIDFEHFK